MNAEQMRAVTAANLTLAAALEKSADWYDQPHRKAEHTAADYHTQKITAALTAALPSGALTTLAAAYLKFLDRGD